MHKTFWIVLLVTASIPVWAKPEWSRRIPDAEASLPRERRQFTLGDWVPLTQPCISCKTLTDPADSGRRNEEFGLTPPRPPTVTRQIHKTTFFPQDESSILSVPPPPVFTRNQISNGNLQSPRFNNFLQQFGNPNSIQFEAQPLYTQTQFLPQTFISNPSILGSNFPEVLPLLNNPSALLVPGQFNTAQQIKNQKETKLPNLRENVIIEQNRHQQQHLKNNQIPVAPVSNLQLPLRQPPTNFASNQQNIIQGNILTPPPLVNSTFPDIVIPGLGKEEIQLLYVPLETLKQRSQHQQQQQQQQLLQKQQQQKVTPSPQSVKFTAQQQQTRPTEKPSTAQPVGHFITHSATPATSTAGTTFRQVPVTPSTLFYQHVPFEQSQTPVVSSTPVTPTLQTFLTPSSPTQKFSPFTSVTPSENLITVAGDLRFTQEFLTTPRTILDQAPVKETFGKNVFFDDVRNINNLKTITIPNQEEQQKQILAGQRKEEEKQKLLFEQQERERQQKLQRERQERERQEKIIREQQERERQQKIFREQQERERQQKVFREQQERERERQQKIFREQQEREKQQKFLREQQERERQEKLLREQQEREIQQQILREQQERERQQKIVREQQERERQQKILREQQERERQQKILREQQERERQQKILREQQERERQQKILREQQERERQQKILREQQERERQENFLREQREREIQEQILREQQERERQQLILREEQERERQQKIILEQQERERQEKLLLEERLQKELLAKQQQEREQQLLLEEQQDRERQRLLKQAQQLAFQQQQISNPLPTQFDLQPQGIPSTTPFFEIQTEAPDDKLVPHQPPLSVFFGSASGQSRVAEVLRALKGARSISVLDQYLESVPKVFVGPANLSPPKGYSKFDLPYLSNIDVNQLEKKADRIPFFVAPLNFVPPNGYSKIPFPAPHVGSVVVSSETAARQPERSSTVAPRTTIFPKLKISTQAQQLHQRLKQKESISPSVTPSSVTESISNLNTESPIGTTALPETTTRGRRPFYRTKARRPTTIASLQTTQRPAAVDVEQNQKVETAERRPGIKYVKRGRTRVRTTTENPEHDTSNAANHQFLVETSPTVATKKTFDIEDPINGFLHQDIGRTEVQGLFEVENPKGIKSELSIAEQFGNIDFPRGPTQSSLSTIADDGTGFTAFVTSTQGPTESTAGKFHVTGRPSSTNRYDDIGNTNYFITTQRVPTSAFVENVGSTGFHQSTPVAPSSIDADNHFYNVHSFTGSDNEHQLYATGHDADKEITSGFGNFENDFQREISKSEFSSFDGENYRKQQEQGKDEKVKIISHEQSDITLVSPKPEPEVSTSRVREEYPLTEATTESVADSPTTPRFRYRENTQKYTRHQYVEPEKQTEEPTQQETTPALPTTVAKVKSRFRTKSRGQVNFASSQSSTYSPLVRKRIVYKSRKEESHANATDESVRPVQKFRGHRRGYQTSTESASEHDGQKYTVKPQRRFSVSTILRRRKPVTSHPETTSENYPKNYEVEYSPSGVSNDVFDDQIRESSLSRNRYSLNSVTYTATTSSTTTPSPETTVLYTRRQDDVREGLTTQRGEEIETENYPDRYFSEGYVTDLWKTTIGVQQTRTTESTWPKIEEEEEDSKNQLEIKKAFDPTLEKKGGRRRIRVRVHKRPHEQIEAAESQSFGTLANALVPSPPPKPSVEPDLYRFSKTGFNFDQSEKFTGTKNQAYVRNITSEILENTATFSAPGIEGEADESTVTVETEEPVTATTTTTTTTTNKATTMEVLPEMNDDDSTYEKTDEDESDEAEKTTTTTTTTTKATTTTTEEIPAETTMYLTTMETTEMMTEPPATTTEASSVEVQLSTATEISHETEICFRGRCVKTNSATADDDLRKLVQSADKVLKT